MKSENGLHFFNVVFVQLPCPLGRGFRNGKMFFFRASALLFFVF